MSGFQDEYIKKLYVGSCKFKEEAPSESIQGSGICGISFSPDNKFVGCALRSGSVVILEMTSFEIAMSVSAEKKKNYKPIEIFKVLPGGSSGSDFNSICFSPGGARLVFGGTGNKLDVYSVPDFEHVTSIDGVGCSGAISFDPLLPSRFIVCMSGSKLEVWNLKSLAKDATITIPHMQNHVEYNTKGLLAGKLIVSCGGDSQANFYFSKEPNEFHKVGSTTKRSSTCFQASFGGIKDDLLLMSANDGNVCLYDIQSLLILLDKSDAVLEPDNFPQVWASGRLGSDPRGAAFSPVSGLIFAAGVCDNTISVWSIEDCSEPTAYTKKEIFQPKSLGPKAWKVQTGWTRRVAWSSDGSLLASGGDDQTLNVFYYPRIKDLKWLARLPVMKLRFLPTCSESKLAVAMEVFNIFVAVARFTPFRHVRASSLPKMENKKEGFFASLASSPAVPPPLAAPPTAAASGGGEKKKKDSGCCIC